MAQQIACLTPPGQHSDGYQGWKIVFSPKVSTDLDLEQGKQLYITVFTAVPGVFRIKKGRLEVWAPLHEDVADSVVQTSVALFVQQIQALQFHAA